jgi:flagellar biosynthesis protein FliQ
MEALDVVLNEALPTTAAIALPMLAIAALVGTAVAVVPAATQAQQRTWHPCRRPSRRGAVMERKR